VKKAVAFSRQLSTPSTSDTFPLVRLTADP
jgi:hypothetical protein